MQVRQHASTSTRRHVNTPYKFAQSSNQVLPFISNINPLYNSTPPRNFLQLFSRPAILSPPVLQSSSRPAFQFSSGPALHPPLPLSTSLTFRLSDPLTLSFLHPLSTTLRPLSFLIFRYRLTPYESRTERNPRSKWARVVLPRETFGNL